MAEPDPVVAVLAADTHLDLPGGAWLNRKIRGDSAFAFEQLVELAFLHDVPLVVAGDLLDAIQFLRPDMTPTEDPDWRFAFEESCLLNEQESRS